MSENLESLQDTIPEENNPPASDDANNQDPTVDSNSTNDGQPAEPEKPTEAELPGLEVKYNKKMFNLSHADAVSFAQKGMKYDAISADYQRLKDHAARNGKSISEFVAGLEEAEINVIRQQCKETAQGNEEYEQLLFDKALKDRDIKLQEYNENVASKEKAEQENFEKSIANGFIAINKLNPEIKDVSQIPESVLKTAQEEGISVREAYLLYEFNNIKAADKAAKEQAAAKLKSSGSLKDNGGEELNSTDKEFLKGLWN